MKQWNVCTFIFMHNLKHRKNLIHYNLTALSFKHTRFPVLCLHSFILWWTRSGYKISQLGQWLTANLEKTHDNSSVEDCGSSSPSFPPLPWAVRSCAWLSHTEIVTSDNPDRGQCSWETQLILVLDTFVIWTPSGLQPSTLLQEPLRISWPHICKCWWVWNSGTSWLAINWLVCGF